MAKRTRMRLVNQALLNSLAALLLAGATGMAMAQPEVQAPGAGMQAADADSKAAKKLAQDKAHAQSRAQREAQQHDIAQKRAVIVKQQAEAEARCYQKFAVEGCLEEARRVAREQDAPLRALELQIKEAERREKAADRLQAIEEKKAEKAATPMKSQQREPKDARSAPQPTGPGAQPPVDEAAAQALRQSEAQQRAARQADYVRRHNEEVSRRQAENAQRSAKARADHDAKLKAAAQRKAKAEQAAKQRTKTASPLPPPAD